MQARIYKPVKSSTQSGSKSKKWILEFMPTENFRYIDKTMGWTGSVDMNQELRLQFSSQSEAEHFAKNNEIIYEIHKSKSKEIKPKAYADNFRILK